MIVIDSHINIDLEYKQALMEMEAAKQNYKMATEETEEVLFHQLKAAEAKVYMIIESNR